MIRFIKDFLNGLSSFFFPPICKGCERRIEPEAGVVCAECWRKLQPFPAVELRAKTIPEGLDAIWPVFLFDDLFQKIVHALKYQGNISLGYELGRRMAGHLPSDFQEYQPVIFVPVSLYPVKLRERGYNQAEAIARGLAEIIAAPVETRLLKRVKNTTTQTKLNAEERQVNMQAAFSVNEKCDPVQGTIVVLVDDVFTTGATLGSAAGILRQAGYGKIIAVTAAAPI